MSAQPAGAHFLQNLLLFGRLLRGLGLDINPGRMIDLVHAIDLISIGRIDDFYFAARTLLVHDREDLPLFDQAFEMFWRVPPEDWVSVQFGGMLKPRKEKGPRIAPPPLKDPPPEDSDQDGAEVQENPVLLVTHTYSDREVLRQKNFAELTGEELEAVKDMMRRMAIRLGERRTRRLRPGKGRQLDLRRSLRSSFRTGGEMMTLAHRERKRKPRPLVVIADISGSMERYTRLLLHFIYGLANTHNLPVEAFVFSTRLTRITRQLHQKDIDQALEDVAGVVHDWAGGTRIGEAFKTFNYDWGRRVLGRGAIALIISDGWDRGDIDLLSIEMARLQRSCHRTIWLNPLLGSPDYEPLTRGMQAALPYVDAFLPVHNLASLEELAEHLQSIGERRGY